MVYTDKKIILCYKEVKFIAADSTKEVFLFVQKSITVRCINVHHNVFAVFKIPIYMYYYRDSFTYSYGY